MNRTAFYYDNRSNLKCVLDPDNGLTYYTYDSLHRMTSVKDPWGEVTQYESSPGGRWLGCVPELTARHAYGAMLTAT